jgi:MoxR-like ATPase
VGPPGTGKTQLALAIARAASAEAYCDGALTTTASADWTTFETIGGYALRKDRTLAFRPGVFLRAIDRKQWLLIDEFNRADVDRAFGEFMTVLAGTSAESFLETDDGRPVRVGVDASCSHRLPPTFRVLATMNTWDKTSLFRLSYAAQRRFAMVHVGPPPPERYRAILERAAGQGSMDPPLEPRASAAMHRLFSEEGVLRHRPVGPAIPIDMIRYARRRGVGGDGLAEAVSLFLLPQLEGISIDAAGDCRDAVLSMLEGWASTASLQSLRERFHEFFPALRDNA